VTDRPTGERAGKTDELEGDRVLLPCSVEGGDTAVFADVPVPYLHISIVLEQ
jgi:hypothetical protein